MNFAFHEEAEVQFLEAIEHDQIFIRAVMHLHRDPDYWKERK